jgi:5'-nucleotidase / UDP-sugar diphosphatase
MAFTLQILHASDFEAGIPALQDAVGFSAVINGLKDDFANTVILSSGDNYIPGPFFSSASDTSLNSVLGVAGPGRADIAILNEIGIQASVFGNHEFDLGTATISSLIVPNGAYPGALFPYLSGNLNFTNDANLRGRVVADGQEASTIPGRIAQTSVITVNGEKIGIVAATTPTLAAISSPGPGVVVTPANSSDIDALAAVIQEDVNALKAQTPGLNKIILLAHLQQIDLELALTSRLRDVDVIISGGSNTLLADSGDRLRTGDTVDNTYPLTRTDADGKPILVVNTDGNYKYVGRLVLTFNDDGSIDTNSLNPAINGAYATDDAGVDAAFGSNVDTRTVADPQVVAITDALRTVIVANDSNILGKTSVFLNGTRDSVRTEETNLGNLTADANLFVARQRDQTAVLSLKNGGGIRDNIGAISESSGSTNSNDVQRLPPQANPIAGKEEGDISELDIENSLRFNNSLSLITVTAAQLKEIFEHGVAGSRAGATPGQFPQVGGVSFSYDLTRAARVATNNATAATVAGDRIRTLAITDTDGDTTQVVVQDGQIVGDPNRTFRIVTLGFIADGGDNYPIPLFASANPTLVNRVNLPAEVAEQTAFANYISAKYPGGNFVFNQADVAASQDLRIQNVALRSDNVLRRVQRDFQFETFNRTDFLLDGSAKLSSSSGQTGSLIVTTPTDDAPNARDGESGSSFFDDRLGIRANTSFNTSFRFNLANSVGDGFTFIIKDEAQSRTGIAGGYLGYQLDTAGTTYRSIAIAFDTHRNFAGDFVAAPTFADSNDNSISILRDGLISNRIATGTPDFDLNNGSDTFAWVDYNGTTDSLQVFVSRSATKPTAAFISTTIDLPSVVGPEVVFGFSGATGTSRNTQTISNFNINFADNVVAIAAADSPNLSVSGFGQNISGDDRINLIDASQGQGNNRIFGGAGDDEILVNRFDIANGEDGNDILDASDGRGNNQLFGGNGNDTLFAGVNDLLSGGEGSDTLFAGNGGSTLTGGNGADRFIIAAAAIPTSINTITDFQRGVDKVEIRGLVGVSSFANIALNAQGNTVGVFAVGTNIAIFTGISSLNAGDFIFG